MTESQDMFEEPHNPSIDVSSIRWLLATNQRNLLYMLAAGLVMPPKSFGNKYYKDTLSAYPGWIPVFVNQVPATVIASTIEERKTLKPCVAELDLSALRGKVMAVYKEENKEILFPDELNGGERAIFIPAPLPVTWISTIIFNNKEDKTDIENDARDFSNVPLSDFKRKTEARLFKDKSEMVLPLKNLELSDLDRSLDAPMVAGAMMAMLLKLANRGEVGIDVSRLAFDRDIVSSSSISDPMIGAIGGWQERGCTPDTDDVLRKLFWGAVDKLVMWHSSNDPTNALDVLLEFLQTSSEELEEKLKSALLKLAGDLKSLAGFSDSTVTELFERHPKPFSRVMTLFFLRESCTDLLEFRHPLLNETDYLSAAILFAARDGWLGIPLDLRDIEGLHEAVSHRMAAMAHRISNTDIDLGSPPNKPPVLRELLRPGMSGWTKKQNDAVLWLVRNRKWDCIRTRITLDKGNYDLEIDGKGLHLLIDGEAKAVVTEVIEERFWENYDNEYLTSKEEKKLRDLLN